MVPAQKRRRRPVYAEYSGLAMLLPVSTFVGYAMDTGWTGISARTWLRIVFLLLGASPASPN